MTAPVQRTIRTELARGADELRSLLL
jgi:hypothetical protein